MAISIPAPRETEVAPPEEQSGVPTGALESNGYAGAPLSSRAAAPFECRFSWVADAAIIEVVGEIDITTAPELVYAVGLVRETARQVIMDLSEVSYLDTWALNALVDCNHELVEHEVPFWLVGPTDRFVRSVLEIMHSADPLSIVESRHDAVGAGDRVS